MSQSLAVYHRMIMLIPLEIETLRPKRPWANWLIVAICSVTSIFAIYGGEFYKGMVDDFVLQDFSFPGIFAHVLLHSGWSHLLGNMIFLWVFGNAVCTNTGNWGYFFTFLFCALLAACGHLIMGGGPAIGASGAINGIVGIIFAMYPLNRVHLFWLFIFYGGKTSCQAWFIILAWFAFDIWGVMHGGGRTAYWAHIGGFLGGVSIGLVALQCGWFKLTEYDNRSLLQLMRFEYSKQGYK